MTYAEYIATVYSIQQDYSVTRMARVPAADWMDCDWEMSLRYLTDLVNAGRDYLAANRTGWVIVPSECRVRLTAIERAAGQTKYDDRLKETVVREVFPTMGEAETMLCVVIATVGPRFERRARAW